MTIAAKVKVFFPDYDDARLAEIIEGVCATVSVKCGLGGYVEGDDAELDAFVARKCREAVKSDTEGGVRSRSIEGFAETFLDGGEGWLSEDDRRFLGLKTPLIKGYTYGD